MQPITNRNYTKRLTCINNEPSLTDQSFKSAANINTIMKTYEKTGLLPQERQTTPLYINCMDVPDLQTHLKAANEAKNAFLKLPPDVRMQMGNDPQNLAKFVSDPRNIDTCVKNGLLEIQKPNPNHQKLILKELKTLNEKGSTGGTDNGKPK